MIIDGYRFPAVLNFTTDVAPLLSARGIDVDFLMIPIEIQIGRIYHQRLHRSDYGYQVAEEFRLCETQSLLRELGIVCFGDHVVVHFRTHGSMDIEVDGIVSAETLVVY